MRESQYTQSSRLRFRALLTEGGTERLELARAYRALGALLQRTTRMRVRILRNTNRSLYSGSALGDTVKRATSTVGITPCGGCGRRAAALNRWMVFSGRHPR